MTVWIAFFRGVNVGGNNLLPMKSLPALLKKCSCDQVQTYIQSGNVVFRSSEKDARKLSVSIGAAVSKTHKFEPRVVLLTLRNLEKAIAANPFPEATANHKSLHFFFLTEPASRPDMKTMDAIRSPTESYVLTPEVFYLHAPDGVGKSKLATRVERLLGVDVTARNWQTVSKVCELAKTLA